MRTRTAIIGGGFSGAMLAARLAERGVASALIERTGEFGPGVAYSSQFDRHLLNVRSSRMSAVEGRPDDFVRWLKAHHRRHADADGFAPRRLYGSYVKDRLAAVEAAHPGLIERVTGEAAAIEASAVRLADGRGIEAGAVVLTTGNPAPNVAGPSGGTGRIIDDPWAPAALDRIGADDDVVILGSGLTMVDMVLWLQAQGWRGKATALSRRGLKPREHGVGHDAPVPPTPALTAGPLSARLAEGRRLAEQEGWRGVMEGLRPLTAGLWTSADSATRARFLRHLRPWWDVHRHRLPPAIALTIEALEAAGRLEILAGRIGRLDETGDGVALDWRPRDGARRPRLAGRWLIDCSGPGHDPAADPLIGPLIVSGRARLDALRLGLALDPSGRVLRADGAPDERLFVLGPPARGAFWETTAVPDIRSRIEDLATALAGASSG
ncbi:FAD/NAD(P)-binding protein [Brevundimonas sp.]|uniref:FAD/NAD(P)-binding protein n=1 Tax=Brevundimonas sp. TaxID=1871086 RepID=UPI002ED993E8